MICILSDEGARLLVKFMHFSGKKFLKIKQNGNIKIHEIKNKLKMLKQV